MAACLITAAVRAAVQSRADAATAAAVAGAVAEAGLRADTAQAALIGVAYGEGLATGWDLALRELAAAAPQVQQSELAPVDWGGAAGQPAGPEGGGDGGR